MKPVYILHIYQFLKIICDFEYCMSQQSLSAFRAYYPAKKTYLCSSIQHTYLCNYTLRLFRDLPIEFFVHHFMKTSVISTKPSPRLFVYKMKIFTDQHNATIFLPHTTIFRNRYLNSWAMMLPLFINLKNFVLKTDTKK